MRLFQTVAPNCVRSTAAELDVSPTPLLAVDQELIVPSLAGVAY